MKTDNKVLIIFFCSRHSMGPLEDRCSGSPHKCGSGKALTILTSAHKSVTNTEQKSDLLTVSLTVPFNVFFRESFTTIGSGENPIGERCYISTLKPKRRLPSGFSKHSQKWKSFEIYH